MRFLAVLLWVGAVLPAAELYTGQAARLIIGQPTFTAQTPRASDVLVGAVSGLAVANNMLFVADSNRLGAGPDNHRVLIYTDLSAFLPPPTAEFAPESGRCPVCVGRASVVLGQPDFEKTEAGAGRSGLRLPTAVASDGVRLAVADTDNNRILIWNSIPTRNAQPADLVVGQPDFTRTSTVRPPTRTSLRGPQGVWIHGNRLFVADTQNHRVLIWNSFPTQNNAPPDIVLGQADFNVAFEQDLRTGPLRATASRLLNPVSVTTDGVRLYVTDLGHNRVLIWNGIPTSNGQAADVVIGQPDFEETLFNNASKLCAATGKNSAGNDTFPARCGATLSFPRFALSDGQKLFIADGGNDRILVYNEIPRSNGYTADVILGQLGDQINQVSDSAEPLLRSSSRTTVTPMSLAWDGVNLFVSDPFNRRILVFSTADQPLPSTAVRNSASLEIFAVGSISFSGEVKENDEVTIRIGPEAARQEYKYKIVKDDTFAKVVTALANRINEGAGDPLVVATPNGPLAALVLTARAAGAAGNSVEFSVATSDGAVIIGTTSGATLSGGQDAAKVAPGTIVSIIGDNLSDGVESAPADVDQLPRELAGTQVYFDGLRAPLLYVSPTLINAQIPWEVLDTNSINAYVRTRRDSGRVTVTSAVNVPIIPFNPGIYALSGTDPRPGVVTHFSSFATGTVSVDGSIKAGDVATIRIDDREYSYTVREGDTLASVRDALIEAINDNPDEQVTAFAAGLFTRIRLRSKIEGPDGNGLPIATRVNDGAQVILTATNSAMCCANRAGALVTEDNPAVPGETIVVLATGLGLIKPDEAREALRTGGVYLGPARNEPVEFVASLAGGKTANVLYAGLRPGTVGIYEVHLELNSDLPTNPATQLWIAQDVYISNIIAFPLVKPEPPSEP